MFDKVTGLTIVSPIVNAISVAVTIAPLTTRLIPAAVINADDPPENGSSTIPGGCDDGANRANDNFSNGERIILRGIKSIFAIRSPNLYRMPSKTWYINLPITTTGFDIISPVLENTTLFCRYVNR
jgi:hypothetical protein